ncbi:MAG TPA: diacylglycerol kinase family lipid kinase [Vicinamibacterales bacterium]|nr:diacylglycerol kinase family lipid kinase [Vicinamibacterales bacterium]HPK72621.1 diacylglycerol kinase family lipid kinase [Vicinamibacterales bacterium]
MRVVVIANPAAGPAWRRRHTGELARRVQAIFDRRGVQGDLSFTTGPGHATSLARQAIADGADLVVAWGGDGTINEVAAPLVGSRSALGIVPVGSGNGLARELGIPRRPEAALAVALDGVDRTIDMGELNGRLFCNCAGVGFDAHVAEVFAASAARVRGFASYAATTIRELGAYQPGLYRIETDEGEEPPLRAMLITVANTRQWGNGALIAPNAVMDDDRLDVVVIPPRGPAAFIANLWRLFAGSLASLEGVVNRQVRCATITASPAAPVHVDGEPLGRLSTIRIEVKRAALRVRAPARA